MWVNKCIWEHGFLFFGKEYPKEKNAKFTKQLGAFVINIFCCQSTECIFVYQQGITNSISHRHLKDFQIPFAIILKKSEALRAPLRNVNFRIKKHKSHWSIAGAYPGICLVKQVGVVLPLQAPFPELTC